MARKTAMPGDPVIIKKYANRRLYNTCIVWLHHAWTILPE